MLQPSGRLEKNKHNAPAVVTIEVLLETWQRMSCLNIDPRRKLADTNPMGNHDLSHSERLQAWDRNKPKQGKKTPTQVLGTKHVRQEESKESVCIEVPHNAPEMQFTLRILSAPTSVPGNSKTMKLSKTGIKAVEKTGTVRAAA